MPKVSVIIPVYGVEKFIERCARSLFEQTIDDIEYIFVNDCTKDRSIEILEKVINEYPHRKKQIRIENMSTNSGQAAVRKHGIQLASGEYIIHCDSDDWIDITMYDTLYKKAIVENADIVTCDYYLSDSINHIYQDCQYSSRKNFLSDLISQKIAVSLCNKLIKKECYNRNKIIYPKHNMGEDYAIVVQLAIDARIIAHISKPLYFYYTNPNSISNKSEINHVANKWIGLNKNILLISNCLKKNNLYNKYKSDIENKIYEFKDQIIPFIAKDKKYRRIWLNLYPDFNFWSEKGLKHKIRFLIIYLGLYPLTRKIRGI